MKPIVVGVDGSENSRLALQWAVNEARLRGTAVCAVHAWHQAYAAGYPLIPVVYDADMYEKAAHEVMAAALADVDTSGVEVEERVVQCGSATALITAGRDADLLVVGARGTGGFLGLLMGSVAHQVTSHAPCPVVVVPHAA